MALSPADPSSYSRPDQVTTKHLHLDLDIDFGKKILSGQAILSMEKVDDSADHLLLDCKDLDISEISMDSDGQKLEYQVDGVTSYGSRLQVKLPADAGKEFKIRIKYSTTSKCSALEFLDPQQTAGKKHPYLFSQCQAIHCRSMIPCQDTPSVKATYSANITAPEELVVLMSAIRDGPDGGEVVEGGKRKFSFKQPVPVQSYLIAIAAGKIESVKIGPRSHVWSEAEFVNKAAFDFSETEDFLKTAEAICGEYVWGNYDILVLPPSFPFGGMENPCLTFATPTLLSGDKSNADVVAHEIAHSWTGNLVTNSNFEHFWLNEGFTVFVERKIKGRLSGEPARHMSALLRWTELEETVNKIYGADSPMTKLVVPLAGVDPDDAFSVIPYEKGSTFLWYLEDLVGGAANFEPFLKAYFDKYKYQSISSDVFKSYLLEYFHDTAAMKEIDWDTWLNAPGMPPYKPKFDDSLAVECREMATKWQEWNPDTESPFNGSEMDKWQPEQIQEFLNTLVKGPALSPAKMDAMESLYKLNESPNMEIVFRWSRLGIAARWEKCVPGALDLVNKQGRMKFVRPIYRDLYNWEDKRQVAIDNFNKNKDSLMLMAREMVAKDLKININAAQPVVEEVTATA